MIYAMDEGAWRLNCAGYPLEWLRKKVAKIPNSGQLLSSDQSVALCDRSDREHAPVNWEVPRSD